MNKKILAILIWIIFFGPSIVSGLNNQIKEIKKDDRGNTYYVGGSGSGNYSKIQDAINNASDGDTIFVYNGTYNEHIRINKQLFLKGIEKENPPLIFGGPNNDCVIIYADGCIFENFYVKNGDGGYSKKALILKSDNNTINNCKLYETGVGLLMESSSNNSIEKNIMHTGWNGIILSGTCNNNLFSNNSVHSHNEHEIKGKGGYKNTWMNNTVKSSKTGNGFLINGGSYCIYQNNYIAANNRKGIEMSDSYNMIFLDNIFVDNGLTISGSTIDSVSSHVVQGNTINGKPLYYYANAQGITVPEDAGQVILANCSNCIIQNLDIQSTVIGVILLYSSLNLISDNIIVKSKYEEGIRLFKSSNNDIINNTLNAHSIGINIISSDNNLISGNTVQNCEYGISLETTKESTVSSNIVSGCRLSIFLKYSENSVVSNNDVSSSSWDCLWLWLSKNNNVFENYFHDSECGTRIIGGEENKLSRNILSKNKYGIKVEVSYRNIILKNDIKENICGINILTICGTTVTKNNFIFNLQHATFGDSSFSSDLRNKWIGNYWGKISLGPHIIFGKKILFELPEYGTVSIPWINFDWTPVQKPYSIN